MKYISLQRKRTSLVSCVLSIIVIMAGCSEPSKPNNGGGTTDTPPAAPFIIKQPKSDTITEGNTATLSVTVTAGTEVTFTYQWQKAAKGTKDFTDIAGATAASYTTPILTINESGIQYRVVVTATDVAGLRSSTTSYIATLNVSVVIVWTDIHNTKHHTNAPENGILLSSTLTNAREGIKSVDTIPRTITSIGENAFYGCAALASIVIPSHVTSIGENAFYGCAALASIVIPSHVTSIGENTFIGCMALTSITLPNGLTSIGKDAFQNCTALTSIHIPSSVTRIEASTFYSCTGLTNITLPSSLTSIGAFAFETCTALTSITIPSSVTRIGEGAFAGCSSLASVRVEAAQPPTADVDMWYDTDSSLSITVPAASVDAYKGATHWSTYAGQITGY